MTPGFSCFPIHPVMVADHDPDLRSRIKTALAGTGITNVLVCPKTEAVIHILRENRVSVLILDQDPTGASWHPTPDALFGPYPDLPVIILASTARVGPAVRWMRAGAFDYLLKPILWPRLFAGVQQAIRRSLPGNLPLARAKGLQSAPFADIITQDPAMMALCDYAGAIAPGSRPVLITGETGTGKELMARAVHQLSGRKGPLVSANAAAIDDTAFSDTLFGHVCGAFTGAERPRQGLVEKAGNGTLFLDEIGDLSRASQVKLLRLLEEGEFYPLGSDRAKKADIRVIAATNSNLDTLKAAGRFRSDLYFRLNFHHLARYWLLLTSVAGPTAREQA